MNLASVLGVVARPRSSAYNASKAGMVGLTRSVAVEYGRFGVRCNCVCSGLIDTAITQCYKDVGIWDNLVAANVIKRGVDRTS